MRLHTKSLRGAGWGLMLLAAAGARAGEAVPGVPANVAVIRSVAWAQGDPAREGAAEFVVLMEIARLRQERPQAGLIAVGDRRGLFSAGAEEALRHAVLQGVPVVKLANSGRVLPAPHGLFLDGRGLSEQEARQVLARCLERYGALPVSVSAAGTPELHRRLELFQQEFTLAAGTRVALR
jgi:hypothetical protein